MSDTVIGVELDPVPLIVTKGRDFRWEFDHKDKDDKPVAFPAGSLFFELQTGGAANGAQTVEVDRANGGTWALSLGGVATSALAFDAKAAAVQAALEKLPAVGAGNVTVSGNYTPQWIYTGSITGVTVTAQQQEGINLAVNAIFDTVQGISGTDITFKFNNPGFELTVTAKNAMDEAGLLTFVVNALNVRVQDAIKKVLAAATVSTVAEFYAPKRVFAIDFGGKLTHTPVAGLTADVSKLTGQAPKVIPTVVVAGKSGITLWTFTIAGAKASLKVESEEVDKVANRTHWQLVWLPQGEPAGGDPVARGLIKVQV